MAEPTNLNDDVAAIRALAAVLEETGLSEIEIERAGARLRVSRMTTAPTAMHYAPAPALTAPAPSQAAMPTTAPSSNHPGAVNSPTVGTAYLCPSPGSPPYVSAGVQVAAGQTLMIVEAMKTMNEIKAPRAGKVTDILIGDSQPVEFGQILMIIE